MFHRVSLDFNVAALVGELDESPLSQRTLRRNKPGQKPLFESALVL